MSQADDFEATWDSTNTVITAEEAAQRFEQTPEGLLLLDPNSEDPAATLPMSAFDDQKPTLLFVHGWQSKRLYMPDIPNRISWGKNYNLLIMRWHKRAFDNSHQCPADLSVPAALLGLNVPLPSMTFYSDGCPKGAEQAIWGGDDPSGEFFVREWKKFFSQTEDYNREIRVVPVSLGTQPTIYMTYRLYEEGWTGPKPDRLDIIDPYVGMQIVDGTGQMPADSPFPIPPHSGLPKSSTIGEYFGVNSCDEESADEHIVCVEENALYWLKTQYGVAISSYWTGVNVRLLPQLGGRIAQFSPVLKLSTDWLCSLDPFSIPQIEHPRCLWFVKDKLSEVGAGWHNAAVWGYFWSIDGLAENPETINATTTTEELLEMAPGLRTQDPKGKFCNLPKGTDWKDVFLTVFLGEIKDSTSLTTRMSTADEFITRMQDNYGLSVSDAVQCAESINLSH